MSNALVLFIVFIPVYFFPISVTPTTADGLMLFHLVVPLLISLSFFALRPVRQFPADVKATVFFWVGPVIYSGLFFLFGKAFI